MAFRLELRKNYHSAVETFYIIIRSYIQCVLPDATCTRRRAFISLGHKDFVVTVNYVGLLRCIVPQNHSDHRGGLNTSLIGNRYLLKPPTDGLPRNTFAFLPREIAS